MAELIAAAGAAASILQLAAYSQKVVSRVFDFRKDVKETPKAFRNLRVTLPFIQSTAAKIKDRAGSDGLDPAALKDVIPLLKQCEEKVQELNLILKRVIPDANSSRMNTFWKAVVSVSQDKKVENIAADLMGYVQLLTFHASTLAPSAEEISSIVSSDVEGIIDSRIQGIVLELREHAPSSAITHYNNNSNTYLNQADQHTHYTGQTHITNHIYLNVRESRVIDSISSLQGAMQGRVPRMITATSHSHPTAEFLTSTNESRFPWETVETVEEASIPVPMMAAPPRPRSATPMQSSSYVEEFSSFPKFEGRNGSNVRSTQSTVTMVTERNPARYSDLPEALIFAQSAEYPMGFIEPMESSVSLAPSDHSGRSGRSDSTMEANEISPRTPFSPHFLDTPNLSRSDTRASVRSVHSFSSLRPPQPGYFELDAPAAAIAVGQFESARTLQSPRAPSVSSGMSSRHSDSSRSYFQSETGSDPHSDTVVVTESEDATTALESANALLRFASKNVDSSPSQSRKAYADAISQYRAISSSDPVLCVRKYRSMVNAELGLSLVVADQTKHIARAETHCSTAMEHARRSPNARDVYGVKLDLAKVKARFARLQEKSPRASVLVVGALHGEAFDLFQEVANDLQPTCQTTDDFNSVAQALLGSARMAKKLSAFGVGDGTRKVYPPESYLRDAMERIGQALRMSMAGDPSMDRLIETKEMVRRMLQTG